LRPSALKIIVVLASLGIACTAAVSLSGYLEQRTVDRVILEIDYYSNWNATVTEDTDNSLSGFGKTEWVLVKPIQKEWTVTVRAQKQDDSISKLTISLRMKDGAVLGLASTIEPYGTTMLTVNIR